MKSMKKITAIFMVALMLISCIFTGNSITAQASTAQFSMSVSSSSVSKGDTITVTIKLSCSSAIGAYSYCITYDSSVIEYASGSGSGSGGTVRVAGYGDGSATSASASFTFTAVGVGTTYIGTTSADVYDWDETACDTSNTGANITVKGKSSSSDSSTSDDTSSDSTSDETSAESEDTTTEEATTEAELSDNCYLQTLEISPGTLDPTFDPETYTYKTTVDSETTSLVVNAIPDDESATVKISGNENFEPGNTYQVSITVTAETADTHIYDVFVTVEEKVDSRYMITVDGVDYYFATSYSSLNVPEGFASTTVTKDDSNIILYTSPNGLITCAYLENEDGTEGAWYIVDLDAVTISPLITATSYNCFIILEADDSIVKPEGYTAFTYTFPDGDVTAYRMDDTDSIIILYAMTADTDPTWYRYDTTMGTFVRFVADVVAEVADDAEEAEETTSNWKSTFTYMVIIIVLLIIIIVLVIVLVKVSKGNVDDDDDDDDPAPEDDGPNLSGIEDAMDDPETEVLTAATDPMAGNMHIPAVEPTKGPELADSIKPMSAVFEVSDAKVDAPTAGEDSAFAAEPEAPAEATPEAEAPAEAPVDATEIKAEPVPETKDIEMPKRNQVDAETDDIVKKAAQFSNMNTADLRDVFDMAENITKKDQ